MRAILLLGLMTTLALGCGDDDVSTDGGMGVDGGPRGDAGPGADADPSEDAGVSGDAGTTRDAGPTGDAAPTDDAAPDDGGPRSDAGPIGSDAGLGVDAGSGEMCGGFIGATCPTRREFCEYATGCGDGDGAGVCVTPPEFCSRILDPVCGCDGNDYGNPCMAQMAGQSVASRGRCEVEGRCGGGAMCGRRQYCAYSREDICGRADATSTCMTRPRDCSDIFDPVCGCDGHDYGNECEANAAGVAVSFDGTCDEP